MANRQEILSESKRLRDQLLGVCLLGQEIQDSLQVIGFALAKHRVPDEETNVAMKTLAGICETLIAAKQQMP